MAYLSFVGHHQEKQLWQMYQGHKVHKSQNEEPLKWAVLINIMETKSMYVPVTQNTFWWSPFFL